MLSRGVWGKGNFIIQQPLAKIVFTTVEKKFVTLLRFFWAFSPKNYIFAVKFILRWLYQCLAVLLLKLL